MTMMDTKKQIILLIPNREKLSLERTSWWSLYTSQKLFAEAAIMVGTARKKENSAAAFRLSDWLMPPMMVDALRLRPGKRMDNTWKQPIRKATPLDICLSSSIVGLRKNRPMKRKRTPPTIITVAMKYRLPSAWSIIFFRTTPTIRAGITAMISLI